MILDAGAIAMSGIGYGPSQVAMSGLLQTENRHISGPSWSVPAPTVFTPYPEQIGVNDMEQMLALFAVAVSD